jgi:hypothetical protein
MMIQKCHTVSARDDVLGAESVAVLTSGTVQKLEVLPWC